MNDKLQQDIIKYLEQNKNQYAQEALVSQLKNVGYGDEEISSAIDYVYDTNKKSSNAPVAPRMSKFTNPVSIFFGFSWGVFIALIADVIISYIINSDSLIYFVDDASNMLKISWTIGFSVILVIALVIYLKHWSVLLGYLFGIVLMPLLIFGGCLVMMDI